MRSSWILGLSVILFLSAGTAFAQVQSLIPGTPSSPGVIPGAPGTAEENATVYTDATLGALTPCSFKYGTMHFSCIIPYAGYLLKVLIFMAGGLCLFTIIIAGYRMVLGSFVPAQKEEGKRTLIRALVGFSIVILSYFIVDTVIQALT